MREMRLRDGQLTTKDMSVLKENQSAVDQHGANRDVLKDYSMKHRVEVIWDLNEDSKRDFMFQLKIDDYTVVLDKEEVLRVLRWV